VQDIALNLITPPLSVQQDSNGLPYPDTRSARRSVPTIHERCLRLTIYTSWTPTTRHPPTALGMPTTSSSSTWVKWKTRMEKDNTTHIQLFLICAPVPTVSFQTSGGELVKDPKKQSVSLWTSPHSNPTILGSRTWNQTRHLSARKSAKSSYSSLIHYSTRWI